MKHADRVVVEPTTPEQVKEGNSRPFVVLLDGNRVGDFDTRLEADATRLDVICSLGQDYSCSTLRDRFERLAVLHAKLSAEYQAMARECGGVSDEESDK